MGAEELGGHLRAGLPRHLGDRHPLHVGSERNLQPAVRPLGSFALKLQHGRGNEKVSG